MTFEFKRLIVSTPNNNNNNNNNNNIFGTLRNTSARPTSISWISRAYNWLFLNFCSSCKMYMLEAYGFSHIN